ncbi:MAG: phosphomannose isomerase type II C-terminal cupin domain [Rubrivivax sp.]|nr:phosphomannose isomerase type II C-terminal cupin domain [Rubrivivax sp.]
MHAREALGGSMFASDTRPWGWWNELLAEPGYKVKRLVLHPGKRFSLQRHTQRSEYWLVVAGRGKATLDGAIHRLGVGDTLFVPVNGVHRLQCVGKQDLVVIEVQLGVCREDDIERFEDDFDRVKVREA